MWLIHLQLFIKLLCVYVTDLHGIYLLTWIRELMESLLSFGSNFGLTLDVVIQTFEVRIAFHMGSHC